MTFITQKPISFLRYNNSNTGRLCSQWLNAVIYQLTNHCTDSQDVILFTLDGAKSFFLLQILDVQNIGKIRVSVHVKFTGISNALFKRVES